MAAARQRGRQQLFAGRAIGQHGQRRLLGGVHDRDHELAVQAALLRFRGGDVDRLVRHAGQFLAAVDHQGRGVRFLQHVLAELGLQGGDLAVVGLQLDLVRGGQLGAGAHEVGVVALQQVGRLGVQVQGGALVVQGPGSVYTVFRSGGSCRCARPASAPVPCPARSGCRWCWRRPGCRRRSRRGSAAGPNAPSRRWCSGTSALPCCWRWRRSRPTAGACLPRRPARSPRS
jgi:hypothetical protein